jgi:hypothetical protein
MKVLKPEETRLLRVEGRWGSGCCIVGEASPLAGFGLTMSSSTIVEAGLTLEVGK